jgi:hypothetical protein
MRASGWLVAAIALVACGGDEAGVLFVSIDSELAIPDEMDRLEVTITASRDDSGRLCGQVTRSFELRSQEDLPLVIGVATGETYSSWVALRARGHRGDDVVVSRERVATLPDSGDWELSLVLEAACAHVQCLEDEHCREGLCEVVPMPGVFDDPTLLDPDVSCLEDRE